jgi:hypothetical protein
VELLVVEEPLLVGQPDGSSTMVSRMRCRSRGLRRAAARRAAKTSRSSRASRNSSRLTSSDSDSSPMLACRNSEMWSTVGSVTKEPAPGALRGADEVLGREDAQRLPHRAAAHAEVPGEDRLVGQALSTRQLAAHDQLAQLVVDLLVGLPHPLDRGGARQGPEPRIQRPRLSVAGPQFGQRRPVFLGLVPVHVWIPLCRAAMPEGSQPAGCRTQPA